MICREKLHFACARSACFGADARVPSAPIGHSGKCVSVAGFKLSMKSGLLFELI